MKAAIAGESPPHPVHRDTPERRQIRRAWGYRAGRSAYRRGVKIGLNPFVDLGPRMPMFDEWLHGWTDGKKGLIIPREVRS